MSFLFGRHGRNLLKAYCLPSRLNLFQALLRPITAFNSTFWEPLEMAESKRVGAGDISTTYNMQAVAAAACFASWWCGKNLTAEAAVERTCAAAGSLAPRTTVVYY
ncbi:hypothetical protein OIU78_002775 [Salix suchowensis]|nr:hypothetical protein OIU78_002775 [Salix suchowensis]